MRDHSVVPKCYRTFYHILFIWDQKGPSHPDLFVFDFFFNNLQIQLFFKINLVVFFVVVVELSIYLT
jgi:uncharacterized membrane protein SpoIIM required for sporulation